jgi:hypothetical protein
MSFEIGDVQNLRSFADNLPQEKPKTKEGEQLFLGHVLNTMFAEMIPEKLGWDDGNMRLYFGLYLEDIFKNQEVVEGFGVGNLLDDPSKPKKDIQASLAAPAA